MHLLELMGIATPSATSDTLPPMCDALVPHQPPTPGNDLPAIAHADLEPTLPTDDPEDQPPPLVEPYDPFEDTQLPASTTAATIPATALAVTPDKHELFGTDIEASHEETAQTSNRQPPASTGQMFDCGRFLGGPCANAGRPCRQHDLRREAYNISGQ